LLSRALAKTVRSSLPLPLSRSLSLSLSLSLALSYDIPGVVGHVVVAKSVVYNVVEKALTAIVLARSTSLPD